jgi:hypothetical protein
MGSYGIESGTDTSDWKCLFLSGISGFLRDESKDGFLVEASRGEAAKGSARDRNAWRRSRSGLKPGPNPGRRARAKATARATARAMEGQRRGRRQGQPRGMYGGKGASGTGEVDGTGVLRCAQDDSKNKQGQRPNRQHQEQKQIPCGDDNQRGNRNGKCNRHVVLMGEHNCPADEWGRRITNGRTY